MDTSCFHMEESSQLRCRTHNHQPGILIRYSKKICLDKKPTCLLIGNSPNFARFLSSSVTSDEASLQRPCFHMHWLSSMHVVQSLSSPHTHSGSVEPSSQLTPTVSVAVLPDAVLGVVMLPSLYTPRSPKYRKGIRKKVNCNE